MLTPPVQLTTRPGPSSAGPSSAGQSSAGQPSAAQLSAAQSSAASPETAVSEAAVSETAASERGQPVARRAPITREDPPREGAGLASKAGPARSGITLTSLTGSYRGSHRQATTLMRK